VMHTAVLAYLDAARRLEAVDVIRSTGARWISNEGHRVVTEISDRLPPGFDATSGFVLALDGSPVASTGFHGGFYEAIPGAVQPW
jgi:hypothetical protein